MIDSHCHLDSDIFDGRVSELVDEAVSAGVGTIVNIGIDLETSRKSIEFAHQYEAVYATVGVHPHDAKTFNDQILDRFRGMAADDRVVAIGEIGLDFYRDLSPRPVQRSVFEKQLRLAVELGMPVVIHTREAFEETVEIISDFARDLRGGVFHCFPGDTDDALRVIDMGFIVSVGGVITFGKNKMARVAAEAPLEAIILETDAPYLTPEPHRGKTNHPAYVRHVYDKVAELRGISFAEVEKQVDRTCRKFYGLVETFGE